MLVCKIKSVISPGGGAGAAERGRFSRRRPRRTRKVIFSRVYDPPPPIHALEILVRRPRRTRKVLFYVCLIYPPRFTRYNFPAGKLSIDWGSPKETPSNEDGIIPIVASSLLRSHLSQYCYPLWVVKRRSIRPFFGHDRPADRLMERFAPAFDTHRPRVPQYTYA